MCKALFVIIILVVTKSSLFCLLSLCAKPKVKTLRNGKKKVMTPFCTRDPLTICLVLAKLSVDVFVITHDWAFANVSFDRFEVRFLNGQHASECSWMVNTYVPETTFHGLSLFLLLLLQLLLPLLA